MKLTFTQGPVYTTLRFSNDVPYSTIAEYLSAVRQATSARPEGYKFVPSYKNGTWDGYIRLYKSNRFPSGLLTAVTEAVKAAGTIEQEIIKSRPDAWEFIDFQVIRPNMFDNITLRDYQLKAAQTLLAYGRGVAKMATNSGKTEVIAAMCKAYPRKVLVFTTKRELMYQTSERLSERLGEPVGYIGDGQNKPGRVVVAMIQTLANIDNLSKEFADVGCVMFDECHHVPANTSQKVMMGIPAWHRFGFSGTPLHYDNLADMQLIGATGPVLVEVTNADLIDSGVSAMPYVDMYVVKSDDDFKTDWFRAYDVGIVHNDKRNKLVTNIVLAEQAHATLILVDRLEHGRILQDALPKSIFAHGSLPTEERKDILERLRQGQGTIVIATPIFDEGVDVPSIDLLVLAGGGETYIRLLQRIGRGMRRKDSNRLRVIDFVDDTNKYLLTHSKNRAELYESEGFAVRVIDNE